MKTILLNLQKNYLVVITLFITSLSFGQNLYDSSGNIIWDATANSGYNNNVSLIGRDNAINLNKKQNTTSMPKVGLGTIANSNNANPNNFASDKTYLVWGDNGGSLNDSGTDVTVTFGGTSGVNTSIDIPSKKWKVVETGGDVGATKISINASDFSSLPALSGNDSYVVVVANDASFTTNVETVFLNGNGSNQEGSYDFDGTKYFTIGVAHRGTFSREISFDGLDDVIKFDAVNNLTPNFTMMFWMKPTGSNALANNRTIVSKYNGTSGYRVYLSTDNKLNVSWTGGTTLTSATTIPNNEWHNIAIVYSVGSLVLYIDGVMDSVVSSSAPSSDSSIFSIGGEYRNKSSVGNYFKGEIDEFRLWRRAMNLNPIRYIINQEIAQYGTDEVVGTVIPQNISKNEISGIKWYNLIAYYSMNSFIGTHVDDNSESKNRGYLFTNNALTVKQQSAPMPYETTTDGNWTNSNTWASGNIPLSVSIVNPATTIAWNIVKTNNNVNSTANQTLLALLVTGNTLNAQNNSKIEVSHYLKLDGKIDLQGKSQLVQTHNSDLDAASIGFIERDQQGQSNKFNYNYWSSPVSSINNSTLNHGFTVAGVMKDGTSSTPQDINWTTGINGSPTSPITLSSYWIFKFQDLSNGYANWSAVGQNGTLSAGQGFTLKGSGSATANQNYTFVGKPNNGTIATSVSAGNLNLSGNPYPSAIDANRFIDDNAASITGTLYFWEHYNTNTSHATILYQGGYATYTKTGGTAPVAPTGVSGSGTSRKRPNRYIPVGQGFFVTGSSTGGAITFNNSQRVFATENDSRSYQLFRTNSDPITINDEGDTNDEEQFTKLYLGFDSADQIHRQILIGFMNEYATSGIDPGYDGLSIENLTNDYYFINGTVKLNIQGEGYFNVAAVYPLGVKNAVEGIVKFSIDEKENLDESQNVYIYDNLTNEYHDITTESWEISLPAGTFDNRFSLRFLNPDALGTVENNTLNGIMVTHSQADELLTIKNELQVATIDSVVLYNIMGQNVSQWKLDTNNQQIIQLSVENATTGTYIVKINTDKGSFSKKILIQ
ncbi:LamG-like jellyroll fold domain-containing protein [Flavobacterium sp.]|uniref:LamG-like jellyroll fold domain-containing protein n=1 Tax=Flavobacterium sp. TaxID=239 RepID=UPI002FDDA33E